jgi:glutamate/tyrosine decarboxylase-like PLP-dependent enzyme
MDFISLARAAADRAAERRGDVLGVAVTPDEIRAHLRARYDFARPVPVDALLADVDDVLARWTEHATHPRHLGLFRPAPDPLCVVADAMAAVHDPNLATWDFAPAANEIERLVLDALAARFGLPPTGGLHHFTSGGQEANHTAVIAALTRAFPAYGAGGLRQLAGSPVCYVSSEAHASLDKVAHATGLGRAALRRVAVDSSLRMSVADLERQIAVDRQAGCIPFLVVGTAGTTAAGAIDPLPELASLAAAERLWFHVDAAWGGAAVLSDRLRPALAGIERADSITCDAHKWLSVTVGAGMIFVRHREAVEQAFGVETAYVPAQARDGRVYPFTTSLQWSRRFIGLKLFLVLAANGWDRLAARIDHQTRVADRLRELLRERGFAILNETPLPLVCFSHPRLPDAAAHDQVAERLRVDQAAWISRTLLAGQVPALRACVTSYETELHDVEALVRSIEALLPRSGQVSAPDPR